MIATRIVQITDGRIGDLLKSDNHEVWTSLEGENPGGSIKDRMVYEALRDQVQNGLLTKGSRVSEISAGSTALSLAYYSKFFQLSCELFVPKNLSTEKQHALTKLGARLHLCELDSAYAEYESFSQKNPKCWRLDQMKRGELKSHYQKWASSDLGKNLPPIDLVVGSVGTGHSLLGIGAGLSPSHGVASAEPSEPRLVSGVRNLELERFGQDDPCDKAMLGWRSVLSPDQFFSSSTIETDAGEIVISDSFRLVLGALAHLPIVSKAESIFLVGATNRAA